ncbi:MAG: hypothetical protein A2V67_18665 [Deltaproteobacteria bacterium RBG_13_61_14]|nr:MAG: hypothetical protein A2V67_18665 [Deltaproteobacteria bacterium RBG_13_61_14]
MHNLGRICLIVGVLLLAGSAAAEEEWPPRKSDFSIPIVFGPEGSGGGVGYYFHDLFGKKSRNLYLHDTFTNTAYKQLMADFQEPDLLLPRSLLKVRFLYLNRTGIHFFGIGNDTDMDDAAYSGAEVYRGLVSYQVSFGPGLGIGGGAEYHRTSHRDGLLRNPNFQAGIDELDRPISEVYPALYHSADFRFREFTHNWFVTVFHNNLDQPIFPTRGGYEQFRLARVDESMGADWNYWRYSAEAAHFFQAPNNYNVLGLYGRWDRLDGRYLPFWEYPALGHARIGLADYLDGNGLRGYWENRFQEKNRVLGSIEFRHRTRAKWFSKDKFNLGKEHQPSEKPRPKWLPERKPLGLTLQGFLLNSSTLVFVDAGQTWGDHDPLNRIRVTPGVGAVFYFKSGIAMRMTVGFSDELTAYQLFTYWQAF